MSKFKLTVVTLFLLPAAVQSMQAQPFKVGDYVDAKIMGSWEPCTILLPLYASNYGVTCGAMDYNVSSSPTQIRARAANAEDKRREAETSAALARQPKGTTVGAPYGTRDPKSCLTRSAPARGAPSADQARQYVICDQESAGPRSISLVTGVRVQVASAPLVGNQLLAMVHPADLDPNQPVWNIRGSFTQYQCAQFAAMTTTNAYSHTHNCSATDLPEATGLCYKSTFGEWHCVMSDPAHAAIGTRWNVLPPDGN